ncbi:polysaccharide pyruvyl transferase family protein [Serratia sp. D1N4]
MKRYNIVGAFDRHNYGDILFPLIHSRFIRENNNTDSNIEIDFYALSTSDLTNVGGVITKPLKDLLTSNSLENDKVIMCGGDILTVDWISMIGHISNKRVYFVLRQLRKIFGSIFSNELVRLLYRQKNKYPYVLTKKDIKSEIYYTAVGGSGFELNRNSYIDAIPAALEGVDSISVRENITRAYLIKHGVSCDLIPDTALIMSDMYPLHELAELDWTSDIEYTSAFDINNYIVFQAARYNVESRLELVENEIRVILRETKKSILLLPIGRATGHEDHVVLEKLYSKLSVDGLAVAIQNSEHVLHIMSSLAHASAYIGTSLHGAITSYSFGHKVCAFSTNEVKKLQGYLEAWLKKSDYHLVEDVKFSTGFISLCKNSFSIENLDGLDIQKTMVTMEMGKYL